MNAARLVNALLEADFDKKLKALDAIARLRKDQDALYSEMRQGVALRKELAKWGLGLDDIKSMVLRGHVPQMSGTAAQRFNVNWKGAGPDDYVGAVTNGGETIWFERPVPPHSTQKLTMNREPYAPSGGHKSQMHNQMQHDAWGKAYHPLRDYERDDGTTANPDYKKRR